MNTWQAIASLVLMRKGMGLPASVPKWIIEACVEKLEREYPKELQSKPEQKEATQ